MAKNVKHNVDGRRFIEGVLAVARPRPDVDADQPIKNQYAIRFAEEASKRLAESLSPRFPGITATTKRTAGSVKGSTQLDVNFSTPQYGLVLGISLKSVHIRDRGGSHRYTHNRKRNAEELRIEASGYHKRQPYAVMIGILFLPFDSCDDAKTGASSFGGWVQYLRPHCGRKQPNEDIDRFEKLYVALYEPDGSDIRFFDVEADPPKRGRPTATSLTFAEFLDAIYHSYLQRNRADFKWADGEEAPLTPEEIEGADDED